MESVVAGFVEEYGAGGDIRTFFAPLRVNLIGEYTDIAGGRVLPCALDVGIFAAARARTDGVVRLATASDSLRVSIDINAGGGICFDEADGWANYPKGVIYELLKGGYAIGGADVFFFSNAAGLTAAGLSSSAAIEALTGVVFDGLFGLGIDGVEMALLAQRAENKFVGVMCGIMDQFAVIMGKKRNAILLDCDSLDYEYIPVKLDESGLSIIIMNSNKKRGLLDSKYNERRAEAEGALAELVAGGAAEEGACLCSVGFDAFERNIGLIKDENRRKRARHIISENERVRCAAEALANGRFEQFGEILNAGHESLRVDFEVTGKELDSLQQNAVEFGSGCLGARMTGAGFGGCAIALVKKDEADAFIETVGKGYTAQTGLKADFYVCTASDGAKEL